MSEWHRIGESRELAAPGARKHAEVRGRFVSAIRGADGALHCLDSVCYHAGGPLMLGEIEEVNGAECIRCPWHNYPIRLADGAKAYKAMDMDAHGKPVPAGWRLSEHRQRVHGVEERPDGGVYVRLSSEERVGRHAEDAQCESDRWAYDAGAAGSVHKHSGGGGRAKLRHATY